MVRYKGTERTAIKRGFSNSDRISDMHVKQGVGAAQLSAGILVCFSAHEYQLLLHMLFTQQPLCLFV